MRKDPEQVIDDKRLLALYKYWQSKRGDRAMPMRADIDPAEIPALLPLILLIDVLETGGYRYRLTGTEIVKNFGHDVTGKTFTEALPGGPYAEYITGLVRDVATSGRPLYSEGAFMAEGRVDRQVRRLVLPLSANGRTVDMVLGGQTAIAPNRNATDKTFPNDLNFYENHRGFLA